MGLFLRSLWGFRHRGAAVIFVCASMVFGGSAFAEELANADGALREMFPKAGHFDRQVVQLSQEQIHQVENAARLTFAGKHAEQVIIHTARGQSGTLGYAFEDTVIGKWGLIHYLVGLDTSGRVSQIIILDYQEIRGRPIAKPRFLRQYQGKTIKDALQLHKDIDGITGATISSSSLTEGVRKILHMYELIKPELKKT